MLNIIAAVLVFGLIVLVHEFGHFLLAKLNGIGVVEFSIGMGPRLLSWQGKETRYSVKILPFGGSCMMLGEDEKDTDPSAFNNKSVWARISVVFAGPAFNFILAFLFAVIIVLNIGYQKFEISEVTEGSPAAEAGLLPGDVITRVNSLFQGDGHRVGDLPGRTARKLHDGSGGHSCGGTALCLTPSLCACQGGIVGNDHPDGGGGEHGHNTVVLRTSFLRLHCQKGGGEDAAAACGGSRHDAAHGGIKFGDSQGPVEGACHQGSGKASAALRDPAHLVGASAGESAGTLYVSAAPRFYALAHNLEIFTHAAVEGFLALLHLLGLLSENQGGDR